MAEYIEKEAFIRYITEDVADNILTKDEICGEVETFPAVDVRENVKGKWKCSHGMSHIYGYDRIVTSFESSFTCDCCGWTLNIGTDGNKEVDEIPLNFCPNCGAQTEANNETD